MARKKRKAPGQLRENQPLSKPGVPHGRPKKERELGLPEQVIPKGPDGTWNRRGGKVVTGYDPATALAICERVAKGETLARITSEEHMPSRSTVYRWIMNTPEFRGAYHSAKELASHSLFDEALDLARELVHPETRFKTGTQVRSADIKLAHLRWSAAKLNPKEYSDRAPVNVSVPITIVTPLDMNPGAGAKVVSPDGIYNMEARVPEYVDAEEQDQAGSLVPETGTPPTPTAPNDKRFRKVAGSRAARRRKGTG